MREFLTSGLVLDLVLAVVGLEILILALVQSVRHTRLVPPDVLAHLYSAAGLLAAAHLVLNHFGWPAIGLCLLGALLAHLQALRLRMASQLEARLPFGLSAKAKNLPHARMSQL